MKDTDLLLLAKDENIGFFESWIHENRIENPWKLLKAASVDCQYVFISWMISKGLVKLNYAFRWVCCLGSVDNVKWFIASYPDIDINDDDIFSDICRYGRVDIAELLIAVYPAIDVSKNHDEAFRWSCANGQLHTAKWLKATFPKIDVHSQSEYAFRLSARYGHLETAKWLVETFPETNIRILHDEAFRVCCSEQTCQRDKDRFETAQWMTSLCPEYILVNVIDGVIYGFDIVENHQCHKENLQNQLKLKKIEFLKLQIEIAQAELKLLDM